MGIEAFLSITPLVATCTTVVWKTVGLEFIPGYEEMFGSSGQDVQCPRKPGNEAVWNLIYLTLYGILGTAAQVAGLQIATDSTSKDSRSDEAISKTTAKRARLLGFFHSVLGVHHILWTLRGMRLLPFDYGKADIDRYQIPFGYFLCGVWVGWTGWHGFQLMLSEGGVTEYAKMRRHKLIVDSSSAISLIPTAIFLPCNWFGYRNFQLERAAWASTFSLSLIVLIQDAIKHMNKGETSAKDSKKD